MAFALEFEGKESFFVRVDNLARSKRAVLITGVTTLNWLELLTSLMPALCIMFPSPPMSYSDDDLPGVRKIYWFRALMLGWRLGCAVRGTLWLLMDGLLRIDSCFVPMRWARGCVHMSCGNSRGHCEFCWTSKPAEEFEKEDTDLYKGSFSLTYGTLTLLHDTKMYLKCNSFYGLLGPNQSGKITLLRAIGNEQLEGFPMRDELKNVFVEREIKDEEVGMQDNGFPTLSVDKPGWCRLMHICNEIYKLETSVTEEQCKEFMKSTGIEYLGGSDCAANLEMPVMNYSDGWKVKMQSCAAQLLNCNVLMVDEPADHLVVDNIRWLEDRKMKIFEGLKGQCSHPVRGEVPRRRRHTSNCATRR